VRDENGAIKVAGHGWTDVAQLDHSAPGLRRELIRQMLRWVRDFDVDGFRCDVAGLVPTDLWEQAVDILREAKPDLGMLAEAYDRSLMERAFQLTYDGPWFRAVTKKLLKLGGTERMWDKHDQFVHRFPPRAQRLRYLDNHDQQRLVSYLDDDACLAAATLLLTSEGVPLIYNGQEIGSDAPSAAPALFERHPIDWASPRPGFRQHYRQLLQLRNAHPALEIGETQEIDVPHRQVVTFLRTANDEQIFVTINCSPDEIRCQIRHDQLLAVGEILAERHLLHGSTLSDGVADLILGPWGWLIWSNGGW
jgi:glycosidase